MAIPSDIIKSLPHDETAEKALLGAMLKENSYVNQVFSEITAEDFFRDAHRIIAAAICNLTNNGSKADIVTVSSHLNKNQELKFVGGSGFVASLVDDIPDQLDVEEYLKIVKDRSNLRQIIMTSMGIIQKSAEQTADAETLLGEMEEGIIKISDRRVKKGLFPTSELVPPTMELIEKIQREGEIEGLKTGFYELDAITSGLQKGDLIIIAARPSMGKTALALNIAANLAIRERKTVAFYSLEMIKDQLIMRLLATEARVSMSTLRTGKTSLTHKEWHNLELSAAEFVKAKLFIDDSASLSVIELKTRARKLMQEEKLDVVFVDYLQLIKITGVSQRKSDSRAQEVAFITASLKELAKELQIPVVALAQLNRAPETRGTRKEKGPKYYLSDLKESGSIEQDADVVIFLHREDQIDKNTERKGIAEVIVAKQRNGPTGKIELAFVDRITKFHNLETIEKDMS